MTNQPTIRPLQEYLLNLETLVCFLYNLPRLELMNEYLDLLFYHLLLTHEVEHILTLELNDRPINV